jgi:hypothetical protein
MKKLLITLITFVVMTTAQAFTIRPADGLWGIADELNLAVGRAINLELTGPVLIATIYNYNSAGAPTFYVGGAALTATNTASVPLSEPKGGTCLGCPPTSGSLLSSPGTALFEFTSSTTGFVTLPKEGRKALVKGYLGRAAAPEGLKGRWYLEWGYESTSYITSNTDVVDLVYVGAPSATGGGMVYNALSKIGCEYQTSGDLAGRVVCVNNSYAGTEKAATIVWFGDMMDGTWKYIDLKSTNPFTARRVMDGARNTLTLKSLATDGYESLRAALDRAIASESQRSP